MAISEKDLTLLDYFFVMLSSRWYFGGGCSALICKGGICEVGGGLIEN